MLGHSPPCEVPSAVAETSPQGGPAGEPITREGTGCALPHPASHALPASEPLHTLFLQPDTAFPASHRRGPALSTLCSAAATTRAHSAWHAPLGQQLAQHGSGLCT